MSSEAFRANVLHRLFLGGQDISCRVLRSKTATKLRIKIRKPDEVEVVVPNGRDEIEGLAFVAANECWILEQLLRAQRRLQIRRSQRAHHGQILFRGEVLPVRTQCLETWQAPNRVVLEDDAIEITIGSQSQTPPAKSLENWLRKQAREQIHLHLNEAVKRVKRSPGKVYVMGQRTKWGNCSTLGNLSFNWRLVMAPDFVLRYIVTHEVVHLAIPDHSPRFWLTVQSHCPNAERARQWLVARGHQLVADLGDALAP